MSFSTGVKAELMEIENMNTCCSKAQVYGLVLFAHFSSYDMSLISENNDILEYYRDSLNELYESSADYSGSTFNKSCMTVSKYTSRKKIFDYFGHNIKENTVRINRGNFGDDCCIAPFIRGAFLSCGTVSDPNKNYHLEFVVTQERLALDLVTLLEDVELKPKFIRRKGSFVVYFKDSENIEDVLTFMGATVSSLELMGIKIRKDMNNAVNRKLNCDMSNLDKIVKAATAQCDAVNLIISKRGLDYLPQNLREIAKLRIDNPEMSLKEMCESLSEPISRSGLNHRLQKIMEIAREMEE